MKKLAIAAALGAASLVAHADIVGATLQAHAVGDYMAFCPDGWKGSITYDTQHVTCILALTNLETAVIHLAANKVSDMAFYLPDRARFDLALTALNDRYGQATLNPNQNGVYWRPGDTLIEAGLSRQRYQISVTRAQ